MRFAAALLCLTATSCAFGPQLKQVSVNQNEIVANSANELLLMNILRARDREPLHFTSISKLSGSATISSTAGVNVAARGATPTTETNAVGALTRITSVAGTEVVTPSIGLTMGSGSNLDVGVWDTQEFYQGITGSVPSSTIAHYLHQGWDADLLTYMFVHSVDFIAMKNDLGVTEGKRVGGFANDSAAPAGDGSFADFVKCYRLATIPKVGKETDLVPLSKLEGKLALADLALLDGEKFDIKSAVDSAGKPTGELWIKRLGRSGDTLVLLKREREEGCQTQQSFLALDGPATQSTTLFQGEADEHSVIASGKFRLAPDSPEIPVQVQLVLRSTNGVIYYLGEYLRAGQAAPKLTGYGARMPIIAVIEQRPEYVFVSTKFKGTRYYVPGTNMGQMDATGGRSSQVFSLVQQLLNLQKSAKDRPTTQTVRVVP